MNIEKSIEALSGNKHFATFLTHIRDQRETSIVRLHSADTDEIQQISGSIIAYDEMLQMCDYKLVMEQTKDIPDS